jgi:hypothetical protein
MNKRFITNDPTGLIFWRESIHKKELDQYVAWLSENYSKPEVWYYATPVLGDKEEACEIASAFFYKPNAFEDTWRCCFKDENIAAHFKLVWS